MLRQYRFSLIVLGSIGGASAIAQTPTEVQKLPQFAGGGTGVAGLDVDDLHSVRGRPGTFSQSLGAVLVAGCESGVWQSIDEFTANGGTSGMRFGRSAALDGDFMVVGATLNDVNGITDAGSAFIFILDRQSQEWIQLQRITASDPEVNAQFGRGIALEGNILAIGAVARGPLNHGGVYIFELVEGQWQESQFILPNDPQSFDQGFGETIEIDGDRMVIGAPGWSDDTGRAFVYERDENGVWQETAEIAGRRSDYEEFGSAVDLQGDLLVVGAPYSYGLNELEYGDVRMYRFDGSAWSHEGRQYATQPDIAEGIGASVAIDPSGERIYVGARDSQFLKEGLGLGNVRVFDFDGSVWREVELFRPIDQAGQSDQGFGGDMALDGNWLVIGAALDGSGDHGAVYYYDLTGQMGTRCLLDDASVAHGTLVSGSIAAVRDSDDSRFRIRSRFGFSSAAPNVADLVIGATNYEANHASLRLLIEARISQPGGTMKLRLKNWNTNTFNPVHQYSIGPAEEVEEVNGIPSASYIRANDERVELSLRSSVLVVLSSAGFVAEMDFVNVLVRE